MLASFYRFGLSCKKSILEKSKLSYSGETSVSSSVIWSAIEKLSSQGILFLLSIIIARFVSPEDYGLVALLTVFLVFAQVFVDSGFSTALIQKNNPTTEDFSTAFFFNIFAGLFIYLILYFLSEYIALFFDVPQLELISKVVFLNIVINSFTVVHRAKLTISRNFKLQAVASIIGVSVSGIIGVYMAYVGYNVWALVFQTLLNSFITSILLFFLVKWKPCLCFSKQSFYSLFNFGSKLLLAGTISSIYSQLYTIVIGKSFSTSVLGYYNRAQTFSSWFSINLSAIINRALFPYFCSLKDKDEQLVLNAKNYMRMSVYVIFPIMFGLFALAEPIVVCLLTDKWVGMIPILRILCLAYMWDPLMLMNSNLLAAKGRTDLQLKGEIFKKILAVIILCITIPFGLTAICLGVTLYSFVDIFITTRFLKRIIGISMLDELKSIAPIFFLSMSMGVFVYMFDILLYHIIPYIYIRLLFCIVIGVLFYIIGSNKLKFQEFKYLSSNIKKQINENCNFVYWNRRL